MIFKKAMTIVTLFLFTLFTISCSTKQVILQADVLQGSNPPQRIQAVCDSSGKWFECAARQFATITPDGIQMNVIKSTDLEGNDTLEQITIPYPQIKWIQLKTKRKITYYGGIGLIITAALLLGLYCGSRNGE